MTGGVGETPPNPSETLPERLAREAHESFWDRDHRQCVRGPRGKHDWAACQRAVIARHIRFALDEAVKAARAQVNEGELADTIAAAIEALRG